jgi:hypothetical protein
MRDAAERAVTRKPCGRMKLTVTVMRITVREAKAFVRG